MACWIACLLGCLLDCLLVGLLVGRTACRTHTHTHHTRRHCHAHKTHCRVLSPGSTHQAASPSRNGTRRHGKHRHSLDAQASHRQAHTRMTGTRHGRSQPDTTETRQSTGASQPCSARIGRRQQHATAARNKEQPHATSWPAPHTHAHASHRQADMRITRVRHGIPQPGTG